MLIKFELKSKKYLSIIMLSLNNANFFPMPFVTEPKLTHGVLNIICSKFGILGKQFLLENGLILTYVAYKFNVARAECVSENNNIKYLIGFTFQNPWRCVYNTVYKPSNQV